MNARGRIFGFGLVEMVVAIVVISICVVSMYAAIQYSFVAVTKATEKTQAAFLLEEASESLKFLRDESWSDRIANKTAGVPYCIGFGGGTGGKGIGLTASTTSRIFAGRFDEASWSGAPGEAKDDTINPSNGQASGGANTVGGRFLRAGHFIGTQYLTVPSTAKLAFNNASPARGKFTIEAWVKTSALVSSPAVNRHIAYKWKTVAPAGGYQFYIDGTTLTPRAEFFTALGGVDLSFNKQLTADTWTHLAVTYDGAQLRGYINGAPNSVASYSGTLEDTTLGGSWPLIIGGARTTGGVLTTYGSAYLDVDELIMYDRNLSAEEIYEDYQAGAVCKKFDNRFLSTVTFRNLCYDSTTWKLDPNLSTSGSCAVGYTASDTHRRLAHISIEWQDVRKKDIGGGYRRVEADMVLANMFKCDFTE